MKERKKETQHIERNGQKIKVCRYEGTSTWEICGNKS